MKKMNFSRVMGALAMRYGEREAVYNVERNRRYNYAEFHRLTNRIANTLRGPLGLVEGDKCLIILRNDNLSLVHFPVFMKTLVTAVFTNFMDSVDEHRRQVEFLKPRVAFIETGLLASHYGMLRDNGCT